MKNQTSYDSQSSHEGFGGLLESLKTHFQNPPVLKKGSKRKSQGDPLFLIALIIILLMALADQSSAGGALGGAAKGIKSAFDSIFGGTPATCVFLKQNIFGGPDITKIGTTTGGSVGMPTDTEWLKFIEKPMAPWQCYILFGMLPFTILYYFMFDLMAFTFVSGRTKKIVALAVAMFAVVFGAFTGVAYLLTTITNWATGSIIFLLLTLGIASAIMGQLGMTMNMSATAAASVGEAYYGLKTLQAVGRSVTKDRGEK